MNLLASIAASVVDTVNAASLSRPLVATRSFKPTFDLQDLSELRVTIVPQAVKTESATRSTRQHELTIDLAVQQRTDPEDLAAMDDLLSLVDELDQLLLRRPMAAGPSRAAWLKSEMQLIHNHLAEHGVFTAVIRLTYRTLR